jgi:hypothetical protein
MYFLGQWNICDKDLCFFNTPYIQFQNCNVFCAGSKVQFNSQKDSSRDRFRRAQIPHIQTMGFTPIFKLAIGRDYQEKRALFGLSEVPLHWFLCKG